jgi:hypothetical protein
MTIGLVCFGPVVRQHVVARVHGLSRTTHVIAKRQRREEKTQAPLSPSRAPHLPLGPISCWSYHLPITPPRGQ